MDIDINKAKQLVIEGENLQAKEKIVKERLIDLVNFAKENVPMYKELYKDLKKDWTLEDLPTVCKNDLLSNNISYYSVQDDVITDEAVKAFCEGDTKKYPAFTNKYSVCATSGTSGKKLMVLRDKYHNNIHGQLINERYMKPLFKDKNMASMKVMALICMDDGVSSYNSYKKAYEANPRAKELMSIIDVRKPLSEIVKGLNEFKPEVITGYSSVLAALAKEQTEGRLNINPVAILN